MSISDRLYLDHAAITPVLPEAREAIARALERPGNPSSPHADGRSARAALEEARRTIARVLGWRHDVILTSGATEAIMIVVARVRAKRRIVGPTEHEAVIAAMGETAEALPVDGNGIIDLAVLEKVLAGEPALVAVQLVNNETGVIQPIDDIQEIVRSAGSLLLCDCAQAAGKIVLPGADFIAITGQKFGGAPGSGALLVRDLGSIQPSGGQERGYRRGTENLPGIAGMATALESRAFMRAMPRLEGLRRRLEDELIAAGGLVIAADAPELRRSAPMRCPASQAPASSSSSTSQASPSRRAAPVHLGA